MWCKAGVARGMRGAACIWRVGGYDSRVGAAACDGLQFGAGFPTCGRD